MPTDSTFRRTPKFHLQGLKKDILDGDRVALGRAITLIESTRLSDKKNASELLTSILPHTGNSFRVGITGVPGVGKSSFIESFGKMLTSMGLKIAVLSIDPSSSQTRGSILGDKTRMHELANDLNAFIRPSAAGSSLGGVAASTREAMLLCEAAGYELILIETVGVGQSETLVSGMVDYFLLLMLSGGGDELQGIKRGIMEHADQVLINKADGDNIVSAKRAQKEYQNALHLLPPKGSEWVPRVNTCSSTEKLGLKEVWDTMQKFKTSTNQNGWFDKNRLNQSINWFHEQIERTLKEDFYSQEEIKKAIKEKEELISSQTISVREAVDSLFS